MDEVEKMKKDSFISILNIVILFSIFLSICESIALSFFRGSARLVNSSACRILSKFSIKFYSITSFKKPFNLREPLGFLLFWIQTNIIYIFTGVFITLVIVGILWVLSAMRRKELQTSNIMLSFIWSIFLGLLWRTGLISLRGALFVYFPVLLTIGFSNLPELKIDFSKRLHFALLIPIGTLILFAAFTTVGISIQDRSLKVDASGTDEFPNIILISIDSLRSDHVGCYGYERKTTPNIDKLADDGVLFTNAISTTTWTLPAHISMLTALSPEVHQVIKDGVRLSENATVCTEILKEAGYLTAGVVSAPYLQSEFGYNQGFDLYDDYTIYHFDHHESHQNITSPKIHKRVKKWLEQNHRHSFFLFIHYWDVHYDYKPPTPYDTMFDPDYKGDITAENFERNDKINACIPKQDLEHIIALYDGEIAYTDFYIGKLMKYLKQLGIYDKTLVILTADHGDEFFEHGQKGHRKTLFDETLKVPLIIKFPLNQWKRKRIDKQVQIIDIVPTFLSYLSFNCNCNFQGESLMPLITDETKEFEPRHFADLHGQLKCVRTNQAKYITAKKQREQLFDLQKDKMEQHEISMSESDRRERMHKTLMNWLETADILAKNLGKSEFEYEEDLKKRLRSLGYIQ